VTPAGSFYVVTSSGQLACRVCTGLGDAHAPECPVAALRWQLREVTAQLGAYLVTMRETVEGMDALLRVPAAPSEEGRP
jgi:hypothetical protein